MVSDNFLNRVEELLSTADVTINGHRPWDPQIINQHFFDRVLSQGSIGLGESYVDGWWDCRQLEEFFCRILNADLDKKVRTWRDTFCCLKSKICNPQKAARAFQIGRHHYDIGNDLYQRMLDRLMIYSCGYWRDAGGLEEAQEHKLDLVCRKLYLEPGMRVLDIGCGWGGAARFAAEHYQVRVVGVTVSEEQRRLAVERCRGLPVEIHLQDYRAINGSFDRIFSLGMFEHVGYKNYLTFMQVVNRCLKKNGLFLLHTIGGDQSVVMIDPWIGRYIFPNSMLPSAQQITRAAEGLLVLEDWHNFGLDYAPTLRHWFRNFHENWHELKDKYGERFYRMWKYYLLSCAGSFRAGRNHLWQIVFSKNGLPNGYLARR